MKINKRLPLILGALSAIALGSVGFSSWIINGIESASTGPDKITATVGTLKDNTLKIPNYEGNTPIKVTDKTIYFDAREGDLSGAITAGTDTYEDLDFTLNFYIEGGSTLLGADGLFTTLCGIKIGFSEQKGSKELPGLDYVIRPYKSDDQILFDKPGTYSEDYVANSYGIEQNALLPTPADVPNYLKRFVCSVESVANNDKRVKVTLTSRFIWGSLFNYDNPCLLEGSSANLFVDKYHSVLSGIEGAKFNLTITPIVKK